LSLFAKKLLRCLFFCGPTESLDFHSCVRATQACKPSPSPCLQALIFLSPVFLPPTLLFFCSDVRPLLRPFLRLANLHAFLLPRPSHPRHKPLFFYVFVFFAFRTVAPQIFSREVMLRLQTYRFFPPPFIGILPFPGEPSLSV